MKYTLKPTTRFRKDIKHCKKRGYNMDLLESVINILLEGKELDEKYRDHPLHGNYEGFNECHVLSDWLLIYAKNERELILTASRTGTHSDLFNE